MEKTSESYSFFNSKDHDRKYNAKDWADYFFPLFISGVFNGDLQVVENEGMSVKIKPGYAWIDGYKYHLWDEMVLDLEMASGNMNRMDSIVIRLDLTNKWIRAFCKTGGYYAGTATPPAPEISATIHELVIAHISVKTGMTRITQDMIKDTRMDKAICGWVCGAVEQIDFTQITAQFEAFFERYRENILAAFNEYLENAGGYNTEFLKWIAQKKEEITIWKGNGQTETDVWQEKKTEEFDEWEQDFVNKWESWLLGQTKGWQEEIIDWFDNLKEKLSENAAVQLQLQIGELEKLETDNKEDLVSAINSLPLSYEETLEILGGGVKTLTVTLSTNDGESVAGQTVTLLNVATGEEVTEDYEEDGISFEVFGEMRYRLSVSDMEGHKTPEPVEIFITYGEELLNVDLVYHTTMLNYYTWQQIATLAESGEASNIFKVGDTKDFTLTTGENLKAVIIDFNHDPLVSNVTKTAGITFGMQNCLTNKYEMNSKQLNIGGYDGSDMFNTVTTELYNKLPEEMKQYIKKVRKKASAGDKSDTIKSFDVFAFLFAEIEVFGIINYSFDGEGTLYPYFATESNRIKTIGDSGSADDWWLRSPCRHNANAFCHVYYDGRDSNHLANVKKGFSAGFCM